MQGGTPAMMTVDNGTGDLGQVSFIMVGIPGLEAFHFWIGVLLCLIYMVTLVGNIIVVLVIKMEPDLHKPMFLFLCMLAVNDLLLSTTILGIMWMGSREIGFSACLLQMYLVHTFSIVDSAILLAMAFDRSVAICRPLHYATILSNMAVAKMGLAAAARGAILVIPCPVLLKSLPYCFCKVIPHAYCEHMAVVKLVTCANTFINRTYGISVALLVVGLDLGLIAMSYAMILRAVFQLSSQDARVKALGTCAAHACIILAFYVPGLFTFLTHRIGKHVPACIHIILANLYVLLPPMLNPLVYGMKTQQIRQRVLSLFHQGRKANL